MLDPDDQPLPAMDISSHNLIHVETDRMVYRPGDTVYVQGVIVNSITKRPLTQNNEIEGQRESLATMGAIVSIVDQ